MRYFSSRLFLLFSISLLNPQSSKSVPFVPEGRQAAEKPPAFFLAGDSTTAVQSAGGGGWGSGFLNTTLVNGATGKNFGHNGATTVSFRAGGDWANVLAAVKDSLPSYQPYVTIQFGHNDQKPAANISLAQYTANLEQFAKEATDAGAIPIHVTPLSRRNYDTTSSPPTIIENLSNVTGATISAAESDGYTYIDLNRASTDYLNAIGPDDAYTYNLNPTDFTHLNDQGSIVFGGLVAELILAALPSLDTYIDVKPELATALEKGVYYWPSQGQERW